jgi:hypothetical protein
LAYNKVYSIFNKNQGGVSDYYFPSTAAALAAYHLSTASARLVKELPIRSPMPGIEAAFAMEAA